MNERKKTEQATTSAGRLRRLRGVIALGVVVVGIGGGVSSFAHVPAYRYDALGRQIERRSSGDTVTTNRMYYAGWQLIAEYNGAGSLQRKYVYGPGIDEPVRLTSGSNRFYYHPDGLGSATEITATNGVTRESYTYDVYGTPTLYGSNGIVIATTTINNRLMFTGRDRDPDTTLYNYRYRYYSPSLGRFVQLDPIKILGGDLNLYRYVSNGPTGSVDPFGLWGIQFGSVNLGVGDPWMIFDNSSWMDISRGAAATLDGLIPFADPLTSAYADECGNVDSSYQWSRRLGGISRDALLSAAAIGWASRAGTASETLTVSRWGRPGLQPGDWVMRGPANRWNYLMSGKYQPSWMPGGNMPASFSSGQSFTVSGSSLQVPSGFFGPLKGALGQSMFVP